MKTIISIFILSSLQLMAQRDYKEQARAMGIENIEKFNKEKLYVIFFFTENLQDLNKMLSFLIDTLSFFFYWKK